MQLKTRWHNIRKSHWFKYVCAVVIVLMGVCTYFLFVYNQLENDILAIKRYTKIRVCPPDVKKPNDTDVDALLENVRSYQANYFGVKSDEIIFTDELVQDITDGEYKNEAELRAMLQKSVEETYVVAVDSENCFSVISKIMKNTKVYKFEEFAVAKEKSLLETEYKEEAEEKGDVIRKEVLQTYDLEKERKALLYNRVKVFLLSKVRVKSKEVMKLKLRHVVSVALFTFTAFSSVCVSAATPSVTKEDDNVSFPYTKNVQSVKWLNESVGEEVTVTLTEPTSNVMQESNKLEIYKVTSTKRGFKFYLLNSSTDIINK